MYSILAFDSYYFIYFIISSNILFILHSHWNTTNQNIIIFWTKICWVRPLSEVDASGVLKLYFRDLKGFNMLKVVMQEERYPNLPIRLSALEKLDMLRLWEYSTTTRLFLIMIYSTSLWACMIPQHWTDKETIAEPNIDLSLCMRPKKKDKLQKRFSKRSNHITRTKLSLNWQKQHNFILLNNIIKIIITKTLAKDIAE